MTAGLLHLGFSEDTIKAFDGMLVADRKAGRFVFPAGRLEGLPKGRDEILYLDGSRFVPSGFFWSFFPDGLCPARKVFLFASAADAMAAFEIKKAPFFRNSIIQAIGPSPEFRLVRALKNRFSTSRFLLCFPDDFIGRACDAKVGAFLKGLDVSVNLDKQEVVFRFGTRKLAMHPNEVSLSRFEKLSGCHLEARTVKPKGYRTFFDQVIAGTQPFR